MKPKYFIEWTLTGDWLIEASDKLPNKLFGYSDGPYDTYLDAAMNLTAFLGQHVETIKNMIKEIEHFNPQAK